MCSLSQHWSCFQRVLFDLPEEAFPAGLTPLHQEFMWLLDLVPLARWVSSPFCQRLGRPAHDRRALLRAFLAKSLWNFATTEALRERLQVDRTLRQLCGWEQRRQVPSASTFSRCFAAFAAAQLADQLHADLVREHLEGELVFHVSRDSTAIEAREKAAPKEALPPKTPQKRGRPAQDAPPRVPEETRLQRQARTPVADTAELVAELPTGCNFGCKKDSKGKVMHGRGYKFQADVGDDGLPLCCLTTSASLHDSQVAIPLARTTTSRVTYLYELMDAAYDAQELDTASRALGHVPIIDANPRRLGKDAKAPMEPDRAWRYCCRSGSERFNALLKDCHGGRTVRVRGHAKVHTHLMLGVIVIFTSILRGWASGGT